MLGALAGAHTHELEVDQRRAWEEEIDILSAALTGLAGTIYLEFDVPRLGSRIDGVLVSGPVVFPIEFKCGERQVRLADYHQAWDYALDLKNFHAASHDAPILIFDEAQRAWTKAKTADFMKRRKKIANFDRSEPEFLISYLDRHDTWAAVICLVGAGQEIHTGEAGIGEWLEAIRLQFSHWRVRASFGQAGSVCVRPQEPAVLKRALRTSCGGCLAEAERSRRAGKHEFSKRDFATSLGEQHRDRQRDHD